LDKQTPMTLVVAWTRRVSDCEELIVASDSRLSGGRNIDCCQKIFQLPRSDSFICFAGETAFAYPLVHLAHSAISDYQRAQDRSLDLRDLRGHVRRILNEAMEHVSSPVDQLLQPEKGTQILIGGWSWQLKRFAMWRLEYQKDQGFAETRASRWYGDRAMVLFAGDWATIARDRLVRTMQARFGAWPTDDKPVCFDWEPFEVLRDLLRAESAKENSTIGGPPQMIKVYEHLNCRKFGVWWPNRTGRISVAGRTLLSYETPECWIFDPDSFMTTHARISPHFRESVDPLDQVRDRLISVLRLRAGA
jgi:hypothetical protein